MITKEQIDRLDDIGFVGMQDAISEEARARADAITHAYIQQQKTKRTPEEREYYSAFGMLLQALDRFKQAKRQVAAEL
jgi:hypothetical protein